MQPIFSTKSQNEFWEEYWKIHDIDYPEFLDLDIYPIKYALEYLHKSDKILECGFGGGRVLLHLHNQGYTIEGIEYSANIVKEILNTYPEINASHADARNMDFKDNSFNRTLCFGIVGTMNNDFSKCMSEIKRVTCADGIVTISLMANNFARKIHSLLMNDKKSKNFYAWMDTLAGWTNILKSYNFEILKHEYVVSRYSLFQPIKIFRSNKKTNLTKARIDENEYKLNVLGEIFWIIHRSFLQKQLSAGIVFQLRNKK